MSGESRKNHELKRRYMELAGMLKEKGRGTMRTLEKIIAKFCLQEGLREERAKAAISQFERAGLLVLTKGKKKWEYNPDAEWELFRINIT